MFQRTHVSPADAQKHNRHRQADSKTDDREFIPVSADDINILNTLNFLLKLMSLIQVIKLGPTTSHINMSKGT